MRYKTDPLHALAGIIYLIQNTVNGRCYIGQTVGTFCERYSGGRWWATASNLALREDIKIFGKDAFRVELLAHSKTSAELNVLEPLYATQYNSYLPYGYNRQRCGCNRPGARISLLHGWPPTVLNGPDGKDLLIEDLVAFCDDHGLEKRRMWMLVNGKASYHRGWTPQGVTRKHHHNAREYTLYRKDGTECRFTNLLQFCRQHGVSKARMRHLVAGHCATSEGFALSVNAFRRADWRHVVTLTNGEREAVLHHVKRDCASIGINHRYVYALISGKLDSYRGWRLKTVEMAEVDHSRKSCQSMS